MHESSKTLSMTPGIFASWFHMALRNSPFVVVVLLFHGCVSECVREIDIRHCSYPPECRIIKYGIPMKKGWFHVMIRVHDEHLRVLFEESDTLADSLTAALNLFQTDTIEPRARNLLPTPYAISKDPPTTWPSL